MGTKPSANELRELVAELKPRSPEEVMGAAASSNLMSSMFTAAVTGIGLLVCATILMFSLGFGSTGQTDSKPSATADASASSINSTEKDADTASATTSTDQAAEPETAATDNPENKAQTSGSTDKAIEAMGIGETVDPDSKPDSLENRLDKILDGLE